MEKAPTQSLAGAVSDLRRRLDSWRMSRTKLGPIPPPLWNEAAALARVQGVHPIARSLGLDYNAVKRHVHVRAGSLAASTSTAVAPSAFVEVALVPSSPAPAECTAELERRDGARMRIKLARGEDLLALAESFLRWRA